MSRTISQLSELKKRVAYTFMIMEDYSNLNLIEQEVDSLLSALYSNTSCKPQDRTRLENYKNKLGDFIVEE